MKNKIVALAFLLALSCAATLPASARDADDFGPHHVPVYGHWQPGWNHQEYDHRHVILGTVAAFAPYRLKVARRDGVVQEIDLKNGTVILPTGATPRAAERVAVIGYYSKGTFIANRVLLHAQTHRRHLLRGEK